MVTADAMRTQVDTAGWVTRRGGHYPLTVKGNQKTLHRTLKTLPWKSVPSASWVDTSHGRRVRRTVKAVEAPPGWTSPQPPRCSRSDAPGPSRAGSTLRWSTRVCSLPMTDAQPEAVAAWLQGHWGTENRLHRVRDMVTGADRHQLRTRNGPQVMATLRNLAISLIRLACGPGTAIASTTRSLSRQPKRAIRLLTQPTT